MIEKPLRYQKPLATSYLELHEVYLDSIKSLGLETFHNKPGFSGAVVSTALKHLDQSRGMNPSVEEIHKIAKLVDEWAKKERGELTRGKIIDLTHIACTWV